MHNAPDTVIKWINSNGELRKPYNIASSNCHYFASRVYEAITRTAGKRLDEVAHDPRDLPKSS